MNRLPTTSWFHHPPTLPSEDTVVPDVSRANLDISVRINNTILTLQAWDDKVDLIKLLGTPLSENTKILENADTITGSF